MDIQEIKLERLKQVMQIRLSEEFIQDCRVDFIADLLSDQVICNFKQSLLKLKAEEEEIIIFFKFPSSWIQHLKKRLGMKYKTVSHEKKVLIKKDFVFPYNKTNIVDRFGDFERLITFEDKGYNQ